MSEPRWVYFIRPIGADGPVKIGVSGCPEHRVEQYLPWSPLPLEIVARIEGNLALEARFHAAFARQHLHHEWFAASPELTDTVNQIAAGTFDVAALPIPCGSPLPRRRLATSAQRASNKALRKAVAAHLGGPQYNWPKDARWAAESMNGPSREHALAILNGYLAQAA